MAGLRDALRERERAHDEQRQREQAERAAAQARAERERRLFADAVGPVTPLPARGRRRPADPPTATPQPRQRELDEQAALREAWSDAVDVESLLLTDDGLGFRRAGVGPDVLARLRRGQWALQGQLDLHGLRREEARAALVAFLAGARRQGLRCLRVVHGKGLGSPGREPVLKAKVQRWLAQSDAVIAFAQASAPQGGAGALIVLLAGSGAR
ncbi:MAG: Smr/MutS family protein [Rubrivivax sp.]|nr:Smr/MutS family protein [Rubrivivax sp.]